MKAAALTRTGTFEVVDVDDPTPGPGELVLRVGACGICGSDLKSYKSFPAGAVLGHEFCGEVVAVGQGVSEWRAGAVAAALPVRPCGSCRWCLGGEPAHCEKADLLGLGISAGAFAEYVRVDSALSVPITAGLGHYGALVEPLAVGLHAVAAARLRPEDRVLVIGGGSVGVAVTTWARRLGAGEIVVSDPAADRRDSAAVFGATAVHDPSAGPAPGEFDAVIECVGAPGLVQSATQAATVHGRVVVAGVCLETDPLVPIVSLMKEVEIAFAVYYRLQEFAAAARALDRGEIDPGPFVTDRVALDQVGDAFTRLEATTADRKILVEP
ncbi:MAG TPA: alcohol dehydrogenase catalytic domain-containing protein [Acidimicrobiales bacterium]|jgi:2-desacetyl-2-hydroxyethyl bacteriochlorophyllide A dehydrogenase|nr:alcohol dehydrogenase catalytic domain-containing protein [Acidimicrobiales bacterium]